MASATKRLEALLLGQGTEAPDDFAIRAGECEGLRDLRMKPQYARDLSSVSSAVSLTYSSPPRGPTGSKRTRTRAGSNVTMLPFSKASTSWGRFASSVRASASGFRLPSPRNWMTDGCCDERTASSVPKSTSADTTIRCSAAARSNIHRRRRAAILLSERGWHHDRPVAGEQRALAKERCRSKTSFAGGEGQRSFADGFGRKEQRFADVVSLEVGVQREDALCRLPFSREGNDGRNWNPKTAKTRNSPHLAGIGRDPLELHIDSVARRPLICERPRSGSRIRQATMRGPERLSGRQRCHSLARRTNVRGSTRATDWRRRASTLRIASSTASRSLPTSSARKRSTK